MKEKSIIAVILVLLIGLGAYYWQQGKAASEMAATNISINFGNNSYDALQSIELSPAGQDIYVRIPLSGGQLGAGNFYEHLILGGKDVCTYDLRITKVKGDISLRPGVNLCAATFYHFEEDS